MIGKNFKIYSFKITEKMHLWNSPAIGTIWSLIAHVDQPLIQ